MSDQPNAWMTGFSEKRGVPTVDVDYLKSDYWEGKIGLNWEKDLGEVGVVRYLAKQKRCDQLTTWNILPETSYLLVAKGLLPVFDEYCSGDFTVHPASVQCKDGIVDDFVIIRSTLGLSCTDVDQSVVKWYDKERLIFVGFRHLVFRPGCLMGHHMAKDIHGRRIVVSTEFKVALESVGKLGVEFIDPRTARATW